MSPSTLYTIKSVNLEDLRTAANKSIKLTKARRTDFQIHSSHRQSDHLNVYQRSITMIAEKRPLSATIRSYNVSTKHGNVAKVMLSFALTPILILMVQMGHSGCQVHLLDIWLYLTIRSF